MKKLLVAATGSVAIIKLEKTIELLKQEFEVKLIVSNYVLENFPDVKKLNPVIEDTSLASFPKHIEVSKWADQILVVPATANTISKFHAGIADTPLTSTLIAARQKLIFVPAMNTFMYHAICDRNIISNLEQAGHIFVGPASGQLREGESGLGRMVEPEEIFEVMKNLKNPSGKKVLIPYGASKVWLDPVRYITNGSSGKMAKSLENALKLKGFKVEMIDVGNYSNEELVNEIKTRDFDIYISVAALADINFKPQETKIKKDAIESIQFNFTKNIDVLTEIKKAIPNKTYVAFKYDNDKQNAINKKNNLDLDIMVWNQIGSMNSSNMSGAILNNAGEIPFDNKTKQEVAKLIVEVINNG